MSQKYFKHSYYSPMLENIGLNIYNTGYQRCIGGHSWGPGIRDYYLMHLVTSGKGIFTVNDTSFEISEGDAFIIKPNTLVSYVADENDPWEYYWVGFNGADASRLVELTSFEQDNPILKFSEQETALIKKSLLNIYSNFGTTAEQEIMTVSRLFEVFSLIIKFSPKKREDSSLARNYIKDAVKFIARNFSDNIDVEDIANHVGLSRSHLYRIFMKHLFLSPNECLTQYRINEACKLIRSTSLSIGEIANSVGFDDQLYFSRVFKKQKGVPPSKYLKMISENEKNEKD